MSQVALIKQKQQTQGLLSHDTPAPPTPTRAKISATFQSQAFDQTPPQHYHSHSDIFSERPVSAQVTRASYQDSNIFNLNERYAKPTVQSAAVAQNKQHNIRFNNTYTTSVQNSNPYFKEYHTDIVRDKPLPDQQTDFARSSTNHLLAPPPRAPLEEQHIDAREQKAREFYGASAEKYGLNEVNRRDGVLMAGNADWKNREKHPDLDSTLQTANLDPKERKYQHLQSSVFGGGYIEQEPIRFNPDAPRGIATNAQWHSEALRSKPNNGAGNVDAFRMMQNNQISQLDIMNVSDQNMAHMPLRQPKAEPSKPVTDIPLPKPRKVDEEFSQWQRRQEKQNQDYNPKKHQQIVQGGSHFGQEYSAPAEESRQPEILDYQVDGHATRAVKQTFLASQNLVTGESSLNYYSQAKEATPQIVDMVVSNLPKHFDEKALRKVSGSKHIISAVVDVDNFTGSCKGTGRI